MLPRDDVGAGPVVVLIHAGVADRTMWAEHLSPMAEAGFRVIAFDLPGFGEAPIAPGDQPPWTDVVQSLDALGIASVALVGNSLGGAVALRLAVTAPRRVSALALISAPPPVLKPSPKLEAAWQAEEAALEQGDIDGAVGAVINAWLQPGASPQLRERVAVMQRRAFISQISAPSSPEVPDPLEEDPGILSLLRIPILVAVGEHDMLDFREGADDLVRLMPSARREVIAGAGHPAPLEAPQTTRELLIDFLRHGA